MMLLRMIRVELIKLRRSPVWLAFLLLPLLPAIMGTFNYLQNIAILQKEWYSLWTQHTLFTCYFFMPAMIGIYCSFLCRLEHQNQNWNVLLSSPVPLSSIFLAKLFSASLMVLLTQVWTGILFFISGRLAGLASPPPAALPLWLFCGLVGGAVICAVQLCVSLMIRSFAVPVGVAFAGGIAGLAAIAKGFGAWFPYSLICLGMRANNPDGSMPIGMHQFIITCMLIIFVFSFINIHWLKNHDVVNG